MKTIRIPAGQVRSGHVLPAQPDRLRRVVLDVVKVGSDYRPQVVNIGPMPPYLVPMAPTAPLEYWHNDTLVEVEAHDLTPAQEHAEELLELVRYSVELGGLFGYHIDKARALLDKIDPPKPPTLEEAPYALQCVTEYAKTPGLSGQQEQAAEVLVRARRAGLLK